MALRCVILFVCSWFVYYFMFCFHSIQNQLRLLVSTEDGFLYVYNMDSNEGGDLTLYKQHRLDGKIDETKTDGPPRSDPVPIQDGGNYFLIYMHITITNVSFFFLIICFFVSFFQLAVQHRVYLHLYIHIYIYIFNYSLFFNCRYSR